MVGRILFDLVWLTVVAVLTWRLTRVVERDVVLPGGLAIATYLVGYSLIHRQSGNPVAPDVSLGVALVGLVVVSRFDLSRWVPARFRVDGEPGSIAARPTPYVLAVMVGWIFPAVLLTDLVWPSPPA